MTNLTNSPLETATDILLSPAGLEHNDLQKILGQVMTHNIDNADIYFQTSRFESVHKQEDQQHQLYKESRHHQ